MYESTRMRRYVNMYVLRRYLTYILYILFPAHQLISRFRVLTNDLWVCIWVLHTSWHFFKHILSLLWLVLIAIWKRCFLIYLYIFSYVQYVNCTSFEGFSFYFIISIRHNGYINLFTYLLTKLSMCLKVRKSRKQKKQQFFLHFLPYPQKWLNQKNKSSILC